MHERNSDFENEVSRALQTLRDGGVILYPTDTIWGLGCDATNEKAIEKIYKIKHRPDSKSLIILLADERDLLHYVASFDPLIFEFLESQQRPTTVIYEHGIHLPDNLLGADGSIAIRITSDPFCRNLIKRLRKPIVSTSANISGDASPQSFNDINPSLITEVTYAVNWRHHGNAASQHSQIVKFENGAPVFLRQ